MCLAVRAVTVTSTNLAGDQFTSRALTPVPEDRIPPIIMLGGNGTVGLLSSGQVSVRPAPRR